MESVFVTGIGILSPIGLDANTNLYALRNSICGITEAKYVDTKYAQSLPLGEVHASTKELLEMATEKNIFQSRTTMLADCAFREAIKQSQLTSEDLQSPKTAFVNGSSVGGMCLTDELYKDANKKSTSDHYLTAYPISNASTFIQKKYKIGGVINTFNTACSSSANAIMYGCRLIENGYADTVIVGGSDSLAKFTINGFNALRILSSRKCQPFDASRNGLNLGEGAAYLVLQKESVIKDKPILAQLSGYANTNDAFHPTSLSDNGEGPFQAMAQALDAAKLVNADINYINTHGTATENNDLIESKAIMRLYGNRIPHFTSTKSNTGHTLGAASAIEAVFSILMLQQQEIYPQLRFENAIAETQLKPVTSLIQTSLNHVMSNSFAFGGNCSSLIFSKV